MSLCYGRRGGCARFGSDPKARLPRRGGARSDPDDGVATVRSWLEKAEAHRVRGAELIGESAVSDIIREQKTALRFLREGRFTVVRMVFEKA